MIAFLLIVAAGLFLVSIWTVVPAPIYALLPLGVIAPEVSPVLAAVAVLIGVAALRGSGRRRTAILFLSTASLVVTALPMLQIASTRARFDAATRTLPAAATGRESDQISITRDIVFAEPGGTPLTLEIYRSDVKQPLPVVIQLYGGAWRQGEPGDDARFATTLARRGYLVAAIDYRHAPASRWPAQIDDVRAAVEFVISHVADYGGDQRLIALIGRSSGAQLALVEAYTEPGKFSAVVSLYGPTDLAEGWRTPPSPDPLPVRPVLEAFLGGTPADVPARYAAASPVTYVSRRAPPTLLIYGARDHIVESRFGRELDARLKAAGATSIYLEVPWAEHAFDLIPGLSARLVQPYVERFLAANLQ